MTHTVQDNQLIAALEPHLQHQLQLAGTWVELVVGQLLNNGDQAPADVYFPGAGVIALMMQQADDKAMAITLVSHAGMLGIYPLLSGADAPYTGWVIIPGHALRIPVLQLNTLRASLPTLSQTLDAAIAVHVAQLAQAVVCHGLHSIQQRLASLLLQLGTQLQQAHLHLTHTTLAKLLGVRRSGVTLAAHALQQQCVVRYSRGDITLLDIASLNQMACQCAAMNQAYQTWSTTPQAS